MPGAGNADEIARRHRERIQALKDEARAGGGAGAGAAAGKRVPPRSDDLLNERLRRPGGAREELEARYGAGAARPGAGADRAAGGAGIPPRMQPKLDEEMERRIREAREAATARRPPMPRAPPSGKPAPAAGGVPPPPVPPRPVAADTDYTPPVDQIHNHGDIPIPAPVDPLDLGDLAGLDPLPPHDIPLPVHGGAGGIDIDSEDPMAAAAENAQYDRIRERHRAMRVSSLSDRGCVLHQSVSRLVCALPMYCAHMSFVGCSSCGRAASVLLSLQYRA
jgi:hypothetical protein